MPAGTETIYIPGAFLLSATHNLYLHLSILLTLPLSLVHTLQAWFCLPPSFSFSLRVPSCVYLAYCFHTSALCYPSQPLTLPPLPAFISPHLRPLPCLHSPVSSLSLHNSLREDSLHSCVFFRLAHCCPSLIGPSLEASHKPIYIHMRNLSRIYTYSVYKLTEPGLLSANHYIQSDVTSVSHMYAVVLVR